MASGVNILKQRLEKLKADHPDETFAIAFPDDGASKRFKSHFDEYPQIVCKKVRNGDHRKVTIDSGDPTGCHVVIIDDLVQSGGTLIECMHGLFENGAAEVSAYVTHAIFPNESWRKFTEDHLSKKFSNFFITNSCPISEKLKDVQPFEVLSLTDDLMTHLLPDMDA